MRKVLFWIIVTPIGLLTALTALAIALDKSGWEPEVEPTEIAVAEEAPEPVADAAAAEREARAMTSPKPIERSPALPAAVKQCAKLFEGMRGAGLTMENAAALEGQCRDARALAPEACQAFLRAASRAGFKAGAVIDVWDNVGTQQYLDAMGEAKAARMACGI